VESQLAVKRAFGMHYDVVPWDKVVQSARPPNTGSSCYVPRASFGNVERRTVDGD